MELNNANNNSKQMIQSVAASLALIKLIVRIDVTRDVRERDAGGRFECGERAK